MTFLRNLWITLRVVFRRLFQGPRRPSWSWRYETLIDVLRVSFPFPMAGREQEAREVLDRVGEKLLRAGLADFSPANFAGVSGLWVEPLGVGSEQKVPTGIVLYLHGGGYVIGSADSHRPLMAEISSRAQVRVLGINYRLAPENRCPAAIEDVVEVYRALIEENDPSTILLAGDSAGGGLVVTSLVAIRDAKLPLPAGAVLFSPWTDLTLSGDTIRENVAYDYLREEAAQELASADFYRGELEDNDPRVSPLFADLHGLPPMLIFAGEAEILLDDSRRLARRAEDVGVEVQLCVEPDEIHDYPLFVDHSPCAEHTLQLAAEFITKRLSIS